jgi:hypothetical protein
VSVNLGTYRIPVDGYTLAALTAFFISLLALLAVFLRGKVWK